MGAVFIFCVEVYVSVCVYLFVYAVHMCRSDQIPFLLNQPLMDHFSLKSGLRCSVCVCFPLTHAADVFVYSSGCCWWEGVSLETVMCPGRAVAGSQHGGCCPGHLTINRSPAMRTTSVR